jgi:hypothetical protein
MKKLNVKLENCYGIKKIEHTFDFSSPPVYAIYAPNGSMKSSLAQTFKDLAEGSASKDRIFPARVCTRKITDESGADLAPATVLVVPPYDEVFSHNEKTSVLLVNNKLRKEYEDLHVEIDKSKDSLLKGLKEQSGSKKDLEKEISSTFTTTDTEFYRALIRIKDELLSQKDAPFAEVQYDTIFDEKVLAFLSTKDFRTAIADYITRYNELLAASIYFQKGIFEYYNASTVAKSLAENGFFDAKHTVSFNNGKRVEITTVKQLEEMIAKEKEAITKDKELRKKFVELEKLITKNANVRDFQAYIVNNESLLPHLANVEKFKEEIWKSYLKVKIDLYNDLVGKFRAAAARKQEIVDEATKQRTEWERVMEIFNERFFVPFKLNAKNRVAVILGDEPMLSVEFIFEDGKDNAQVEKATLLKALSQGEKKALYILNIIFEVERRRTTKQETLFVVDDIADSFDYKNKYAIIQYLKEIADEPCFRQIILTHNFDFFRTINLRFVPYQRCLMVAKSSHGITLEKATGVRNVFVNDWKPHFFTDRRKKIASIPFIRNIVEYTKGEMDADYAKLTSLLHWKADTSGIGEAELDAIFTRVFGGAAPVAATKKSVVDIINDEAKGCLKNGDGAHFEHKVVLSIAIRMAAERFMVNKIGNGALAGGITANQTPTILGRVDEKFAGENAAIKTLRCVVLMTPENIHLNSFMYEPIIDMSDEHLKKLYVAVSSLK